ncbi:hypothetical protein [Saccharothrix luteola]|uniref:hypothetical protein n=1 Tax=Saccharothrix luteola TaxID=2893018 RepID=UPI001E4D8C83|nr:hypothetical protein [Saccharothrix luteola]MCC8246473.1 hypothetical protein [Saccharothrix luteola]
MARVVTWSGCGLVVVLALAWGVLAQPTSVAGEAHPWSGNTPLVDYDYSELTHEAFDATGAVIPGR